MQARLIPLTWVKFDNLGCMVVDLSIMMWLSLSRDSRFARFRSRGASNSVRNVQHDPVQLTS